MHFFMVVTRRHRDIPGFFSVATRRNRDIPDFFTVITLRGRDILYFFAVITQRKRDIPDFFAVVTRRNRDIPDFIEWGFRNWEQGLPTLLRGGNVQEVRGDAGAVQQAQVPGAEWGHLVLCLELQKEDVLATTCTLHEHTPAEVVDVLHHAHLPLDIPSALAHKAHPQVLLAMGALQDFLRAA